jgi:hypothetical protein
MIAQKNIVVDAFPGFNEVELAEFRINYLRNFVERVVIVESTLTHSGNVKPLYISNWLATQPQAFKDRVEVVEVDLSNLSTSWEREIHTREYLFDYIKKEFPDSRYILSDLDEIPSVSQVVNLRNSTGTYHFHTPTSYRRLNWELSDSHANWKLGLMGEINSNDKPNAGRFFKYPLMPGDPGMHFSYLGGGSKAISEKYSAIAHTELNVNYWKSSELFNYCDKFRIDHLGRGRNRGMGVFHVNVNSNNDVLLCARAKFPQLYDEGEDLPNILFRMLASIKVSSYVGTGLIAKVQQKLFKPSFFFSSRSPLVQIGPIFELFIVIIYQIKYFVFRRN